MFIKHCFLQAIKGIKASFYALYDSMKESSYAFFSESVFSDQNKNEFVIEGKDLLFFIFFKFWTRDNIRVFFRDFNTLVLDDLSEDDASLFMPGVFYEYFLFSEFSNFRYNLKKDEPLYSKCYRLSSHSGRNKHLALFEERAYDCHHNIIVKNYVLYKGRRRRVFPKFDFCIIKHRTLQYIIKMSNGKTFEYHPKVTGNVSSGFLVSFHHSKIFFKELYCVSDAFKIYAKKMINKYAGQALIETRTNYDEELALMEAQSEVLQGTSLSYKLGNAFSNIGEVFQQLEMYNMNKYIELSGYFLLELFGMTPKIDAFFSRFISRPIIRVEEINKEFELIVSYNNNGEKTRYDFNLINNDRYSLFMSAIPIYKLRLNQLIFLIADFHEGNLAIKVSDLTPHKTKFIQDIQVIDIWPSKVITTVEGFWALKKNYSDGSFDDVILTRLDSVPEDDTIPLELLIQDECGDFISEDPLDPRCNDIIQAQVKNAQLTDEELVAVYGSRIQSWTQDARNRKEILVFYALIDLFDTAYHNNHELFSSISSLQQNICANIAIIMLGKTYQMCTDQTRALTDYFDINDAGPPTLQQVLEFKAEDLKNDWKHYLSHAARTIIHLMNHFITIFLDTRLYVSISETYKLTLGEDEQGQSVYVVKQVYWDIVWKIPMLHSFGFAFSYHKPETKNALQLFRLDPDLKEQENKFQIFERVHGPGSRPKAFYFTCSPVVFDKLNHFISFRHKRVIEPAVFNNVFIEGKPQFKQCQ